MEDFWNVAPPLQSFLLMTSDKQAVFIQKQIWETAKVIIKCFKVLNTDRTMYHPRMLVIYLKTRNVTAHTAERVEDYER